MYFPGALKMVSWYEIPSLTWILYEILNPIHMSYEYSNMNRIETIEMYDMYEMPRVPHSFWYQNTVHFEQQQKKQYHQFFPFFWQFSGQLNFWYITFYLIYFPHSCCSLTTPIKIEKKTSQ